MAIAQVEGGAVPVAREGGGKSKGERRAGGSAMTGREKVSGRRGRVWRWRVVKRELLLREGLGGEKG